MKSICVYCGSSPGLNPKFLDAATTLGNLLAKDGITLVYGGGNVGLMGAVADGAISKGGKVIGVIPQSLADKELAHPDLAELHVVQSMHERKMLMAELSDAFVALPGGIGTLEEILEVLTWTQLGFHHKPCAFLNIAGFYDSLLQFLQSTVEQRFLRQDYLDSILVDNEPTSLLENLLVHKPEYQDKWIDLT